MNVESVKPHSRLGISAFVFGLLPLVGVVLISLAIGRSGRTPFLMALSGGATILFSAVVAFVFGLATIFQKRTLRMFGVIGFVMGLIWIFAIVSLFIIFAAFIYALGIALGSGFGRM